MLLKNIKDIAIENGTWSIIRTDIINLNVITESIRILPYTGAGLNKDEKVENARLPYFAQVFYYLVYQLKTIPSEDAFFTRYIKWNDPENTNPKVFRCNGQELSVEGLKSRLLRTYPSLIRDIHCYYYLLESEKFQFVNYSLVDDIFSGIDITVKYQDKLYGISIHIDTIRATKYKKKKENRHDYDGINEIILVAKFSELNRVGKFYLLGERHLNEILTKIEAADFVGVR